MLAKVEVPYRVIDVAAGDLGSSAARKYDCEAWVPSQGRYREVTSTSNCTTFQARRLGVRYRDEDGQDRRSAATLNGTLATTRWIVADPGEPPAARRLGAWCRRRCSPTSAAGRPGARRPLSSSPDSHESRSWSQSRRARYGCCPAALAGLHRSGL